MSIKALSVDDNEVNLMLIESMAEDIGIKVDSFLNPVEALEKFKKEQYDLIFVDYMMPEMDGVTFIKTVREISSDIPIIMITAIESDNELKLKALRAGATDFLNKPLNVPEFKARTTNLSNLAYSQRLLKDRALLLQEEVRIATLEIIEREQDALNIIGRASEFKDTETGNHVKRVGEFVKLIASALGFSSEIQELLYYAAPLHDIGKIGIPDAILLKPGKLSESEFEIMKKHVLIGYEILKDAHSKYLKVGAIIALTHHEKWDGSGYPYGLKGEEINIYGRITAVADVFDAITTKRPYKSAWSFDDAVKFIREQSGKHFDPAIVDAFFRDLGRVETIKNTLRD